MNPEKKPVIVTIEESHLARIQEVVDELQRSGMEVNYVLESLGQVTGVVNREDESRLQALEGVLQVDPSITFELPPPDADIQ